MDIRELVGNEFIKTQLLMSAAGAIKRNEAIPHTMFEGIPGSGKTTFSKTLAETVNTLFFQEDPNNIKSFKDIEKIASKFPLQGYDDDGNIVEKILPSIVFIDEIHNLSLKGQEVLGIAMEEWSIPGGGKFDGGRIPIPRFTLIGATTLIGKLSKPFADRFKLSFKFKAYNMIDSTKVVLFHAKRLGVLIDLNAAVSIARRGRGTPRILVRFLERIIDYANYIAAEKISIGVAETAFAMLGVDAAGLDDNDRRLLECLFDNDNEAVGLDTLAILTGESPFTVANTIEPYLIQNGFMLRTQKGRTITDKGHKYIKSIKNNLRTT